MTKYIFWAGSVQGLDISVEVYAHSFREAKNKVIKYISLNKEGQHPIKDVKPNGWE